MTLHRHRKSQLAAAAPNIHWNEQPRPLRQICTCQFRYRQTLCMLKNQWTSAQTNWSDSFCGLLIRFFFSCTTNFQLVGLMTLCRLNRIAIRIIKKPAKISSAAAKDRTICFQCIAQYQFAINSAAPRSVFVSTRFSFGACEDPFTALAAHRRKYSSCLEIG